MAHKDAAYQELLHLRDLFTGIRYKASSVASGMVYQNAVNGPVTASSHTSTLVRHYVSSNPLIRLILCAIQEHIVQHKDGGAFVGLIICELVIRFYQTAHHARMYGNVLSWCSQTATAIVTERATERFEVTTEGITGMIQSVLYTKLSSYMNSYELETLVKQLAEIFIMTGGGQSVETVEYITGRDVNPCTLLYTGVMIDIHHSPVKLPAGVYNTVLVSCSLSGETEELVSGTYTGPSLSPIADAVMKRIGAMVDYFARTKTTLLICQKVIHPKIKLLLKSYGISYLERLGLIIKRLSYMTDLKPYGSVTQEPSLVKTRSISVSHVTLDGDIWLLLSNAQSSSSQSTDDKPTFTLRISSLSDQITDSIKMSCTQTLDSMTSLLSDTRLLPGAGEWQRYVITELESRLKSVTPEKIKEMGSNNSSFRSVVNDFTSALWKSTGHSKYSSIIDGIKQPAASNVRDSFTTQLSALTTAISISQAIILTGHVIKKSP